MTKVEAIKFGTAWLGIQEKLEGCDMYEFFKMSVKALQEEQKSEWQHDHEILKAYSDGANEVLEKIRAEIEQVSFTHYFEYGEYYGEDTRQERIVNFDTVIQIIDKHKTESEA